MQLLLALLLALPTDSLAVRLEPIRRTLGQAGLAASPESLIRAAHRQWSDFTVSLAADSSFRPEGWADDVQLLSSRFSALEVLAVSPHHSALASSGILALSELLYWLPRPRPALFKFTGYKCEKCVVMEQVLDKVAADYQGRVRVRIIDVNKDEESARKYRITVVPTLVFLDAKGKEASRVAREMTEAEIRARLDHLLKRQ